MFDLLDPEIEVELSVPDAVTITATAIGQHSIMHSSTNAFPSNVSDVEIKLQKRINERIIEKEDAKVATRKANMDLQKEKQNLHSRSAFHTPEKSNHLRASKKSTFYSDFQSIKEKGSTYYIFNF